MNRKLLFKNMFIENSHIASVDETNFKIGIFKTYAGCEFTTSLTPPYSEYLVIKIFYQ